MCRPLTASEMRDIYRDILKRNDLSDHYRNVYQSELDRLEQKMENDKERARLRRAQKKAVAAAETLLAEHEPDPEPEPEPEPTPPTEEPEKELVEA